MLLIVVVVTIATAAALLDNSSFPLDHETSAPVRRLGRLTGPQEWRVPSLDDIKYLQRDTSMVAHPHSLLSLEHKYLLCVMQKLQHGSKLTGRAYLYANSQEPLRDLYRFNRDLRNFPGMEQRVFSMIQSDPAFFSAAVVRDPWARAVSGYRDKIYGLSYQKAWVYGLRTRRTLEGVSDKDAKKPHKLTFHEFLVAVQEMKSRAKFGINAHFTPQSELCKLDSFLYHYIAELHNETDMEYVRTRMGFNASFKSFEHKNIVRYETSDFGGLPGVKIFPCTTKTVDIFASIYSEDYRILGYSLDAAYHSCRVHGLTSIPNAQNRMAPMAPDQAVEGRNGPSSEHYSPRPASDPPAASVEPGQHSRR